jgi:lipopolysaccharide assembly outer membrane protein LptD (OstA)
VRDGIARRRAALCLLLLALAVPPVAGAGVDRAPLDDPFEITADRIDYDGRRRLYVASGHVRVEQTRRSLRADCVAFSTETRIGVAEGGVELVDGPDAVHAEFMVFDLDSLRGMFFEGGLDAGSEGFRVRAKEMVRTGQNTFRLTDGVFTTCRCPEDGQVPWEISTGEADVELGGYGTVKNATFDVLGVPVLWVPWAFFPVKSDRETGLLLPQFEFGNRGGYGVGVPFFWAAHPQLNVTLTPRYYTERGFKGDAELEYVFGRRSEGELFVSGLRDRRHEPSGATDDDRWGVKWGHDQEMPLDWRWQTDLNLTSDNFYADDFNEFSRYRQFRFLESTTSLNRAFGESGGFGAMVGARYADDIQGLEIRGVDFVDTDDVLLQRFGEARTDVQPGALVAPGGIQARLDAEVIHFAPLRDPSDVFEDQGLPQTVTNGHFYDVGIDGTLGVPVPPFQPITVGQEDGIFQPGEAIGERGVRLALHPRLARPFQVADAVEVVPEVGWLQTLYSTDESRFAQRGLLTARLDTRARLARDFGGGKGSLARMRHVLEPRLGWAYVSQRQQDRNPLFVPAGVVEQARFRSLSPENLTRNPSDRIESANRVVLGLGQRLYGRNGGRGALGLKADLQTAIDWDFAEGGLGAAYVDGRVLGIGPVDARLMGAFDPGTVQLDEGGVELHFRQALRTLWLRRLRMSGAYRYRRRIPTFLESNRGQARVNETDSVSQISLLGEVQLSLRIQLRYSTVYKLAGENEFVRNQGTVEYVSKCRCWAIGGTLASDRRDQISGGISIRFMGLGESDTSLFDTGFGTGLGF